MVCRLSYDGVGLLQLLPGLMKLLAPPPDLLVLSKPLLSRLRRATEAAAITHLALLRQMRRKEAVPAQMRSDLSEPKACIGLVRYAALVTCAEPAALGCGNHLGWRDLREPIRVRSVADFHDKMGLMID